MSETLEAALSYARLGWPALVIQPDRKEPLTSHGVKDATVNPDVIREWFERWPAANVAVACGAPGPQALDIDDLIRAPRGLLDTQAPTSATPRGWHVHFAGTERGTINLGFGELRGRGSYVLMPPSIVDGKQHVWLSLPTERLPTVPTSLIAERTTAGRGDYQPPTQPIAAGEGRWPYLRDIAVRLARGGIVDERLLLALIKAAFETDCEIDPPPEPGSLEKLAAWAAGSEIADGARADEAQPAEMRDELARLLRLDKHDIQVASIRLVGNGPSAALEMHLSNGLEIITEHFGELWTHTGLARFVTQNTGINAGAITKQEANRANALIRELSTVVRETRIADIGSDHGLRFLTHAPVQGFKLNDQASRYHAFAEVKARETEHTYTPEQSLVLLDEGDGVRYVHCGHLFSCIQARREVAHPAELARQMELAGWSRKGRRGKIKATAPHTSHQVQLGLWLVPAGWEDS